jgi:NADH-quinone oxidoreductase subunit J
LGSDALAFYAFAGVAVIGSLLVVLQKNPVYSVLSIIASFFGLAGLYILLDAPFVAVVQIIIYAGAIMVLFLFVVMLLNVPREDAAVRIGAVLALLMALELGWALARTSGLSGPIGGERAAVSSVEELGKVLFTDYMFAFEVTSILIIASMVGAVVLARKRDQ